MVSNFGSKDPNIYLELSGKDGMFINSSSITMTIYFHLYLKTTFYYDKRFNLKFLIYFLNNMHNRTSGVFTYIVRFYITKLTETNKSK